MDNKKKELLRSIKFTLFSISAGVIQLVSYALLYELLHLPEWISYLISLILSVLWNFTLNRKFTFQSAANVPVAMLKVALFYVVFTPLSTWWTKVLTEDLLWNACADRHDGNQLCQRISLPALCGVWQEP